MQVPNKFSTSFLCQFEVSEFPTWSSKCFPSSPTTIRLRPRHQPSQFVSPSRVQLRPSDTPAFHHNTQHIISSPRHLFHFIPHSFSHIERHHNYVSSYARSVPGSPPQQFIHFNILFYRNQLQISLSLSHQFNHTVSPVTQCLKIKCVDLY